MEARIYAEDPLRGFLLSTGPLLSYIEPQDKSVCVDSGVAAEGHFISTYYEPMISKPIVHAPNRSQAIDKLASSLDRYVIHGVENNKPFLSDVCRHPAFHEGKTTTNFIQKHYPDGFQGVNLNLIEKCEFAAILVLLENGWREILGLRLPSLEVEYCELFSSESRNDDVPGEDDELGKIIGKSIVALGERNKPAYLSSLKMLFNASLHPSYFTDGSSSSSIGLPHLIIPAFPHGIVVGVVVVMAPVLVEGVASLTEVTTAASKTLPNDCVCNLVFSWSSGNNNVNKIHETNYYINTYLSQWRYIQSFVEWWKMKQIVFLYGTYKNYGNDSKQINMPFK